jgi:hypothetical protein
MKRLFLGVFLASALGTGCPHPDSPLPIPIVEASAPDVALKEEIDASAPEPFGTAEDAERALFLGAKSTCAPGDTNDGRIRCMLAKKFAGEPRAMSLAVDLFGDTGDVAAVCAEETFDGGFRGMIHIVPELPVGRYQNHLEWVAGAMRDYDALFKKLETPEKQPKYRLHAILFRFFRSVGGTRPSAMARGWIVQYNVSGSLLRTETGARETLFHEIFHSNDFAHGDGGLVRAGQSWSGGALRETFDAIVRKCGTGIACLAPYAPTDTIVRGGTYYAFQPDNGDAVHEYAAELALRWYKEQRALSRGEKLQKKPFKCGPPENARTWSLITQEFFGGIDSVPACE